MADSYRTAVADVAGPTYYDKVQFILRRRRRGRKFGWRRAKNSGYILFHNLSEFSTHMYSADLNVDGEIYNPQESFVTWHTAQGADAAMIIDTFKKIIDHEYKRALRRSFREWLRRAPKPVHHY